MVDLLSGVAEPDLREQIAEIERELTQRARAYPRFVADGRLKQDRADYQVACLRAALGTLRNLSTRDAGRANNPPATV